MAVGNMRMGSPKVARLFNIAAVVRRGFALYTSLPFIRTVTFLLRSAIMKLRKIVIFPLFEGL